MRRSSITVVCLGGISAALFVAPSPIFHSTTTKTTHTVEVAHRSPSKAFWDPPVIPPTTTAPLLTTTTVQIARQEPRRAPQTPPRAPSTTPAPRYASTGSSTVSGGTWACIRQHESGGNYANKSNPSYRGAYQFAWATWHAIGGSGDPADAPPAVQDAMAQKLQATAGWSPWRGDGCVR